MTSNGAPPAAPAPTPVVRRLESAEAQVLVELAGTFEDLQTVLQCCERLVAALAGPQDDVLVESLWTTAMLSYARSFAPSKGSALTEEDLAATKLEGDLVEWHRLLLRLREHHADPAINPREIFSVGVAQDADGAASGVAVTSARQPTVDDLTVRQTGAIAYALSQVVNDRIEAMQAALFDDLKETPRADLDKLVVLDVAPLDVTS